MFRNVAELIELADSSNKKISEIMIEQEMEFTGKSREDILHQMDKNLEIMEQAVAKGLEGVKICFWFNWWRCSSTTAIY